MYDAFGLYDYYLDRQAADDLGYDTLQELYEAMNDEYERNKRAHLAGTIDAPVRNTRNAR